MALRFILGKAGSGKTSYCTDSIIASVNARNCPVYYIVPEQYSLEAEKNLSSAFVGKAVIKAHVLSFERLSYHVLSETGTKQTAMLDLVGKSMVIRKILHDLSPKLKYYHKTPISSGFVKSISNTITELYQYEATVDMLEALRFSSSYQGNKFEDIGLIFAAYKAFIENEYISPDTNLDILNQNISKSKLFDGAVIWIDNFTGFTAQEYRVVENLLKMAEQVNICINYNKQNLGFESPAQDDIYYESKYFISKLSAIANENSIEVLDTVFLEQSYRFKNAPELNWLLENYEKPKPEKFDRKNERIKLNSFPTKHIEVKEVADNIIHLVRDKGLRFNEIAVLPGDMEGYAPILQSTFSRYNIPCFVDLRIGILFHPLTEFVRGLFDIIVKNWSYEGVFRLLKTNLLDISENELDMIENYVIEYGIRGSKWKSAEWQYGFAENSLYDKALIHNTKEAVYNTLNEFCAKYSAKKKVKPAEVCRDIYGFLIKLKIPDKLSRLAMEAAAEDDIYLYRIHCGIWNVHMAVLEKVAEIFEGSNSESIEMSLSEFAELLFMGLSSCDMGIIPPTQDQVIVGDIYRSRLSNIKAVFIVGMTSELIPRKAENDGLLDDSDKAFLEEADIELGANLDKQTYINSHKVFGVLTKASDYLFLYYPQKDTGGKAASPSPVLWKIKQLFDFEDTKDLAEEVALTLPKAMLETLGEIKEEGKNNILSAALRRWYMKDNAFAALIEKTVKATATIVPLSAEVLDLLYKKDIVTSVSRIEKYVECPFSYFLRYNLKVKERADHKVKTVDLGNVFHDAMELFSTHLHNNGLTWADMGQREINKAVDEIFTDFAETDKLGMFSYDAKSAYVLEQVKKISKRSIWAIAAHIKAGAFKPHAVEVNFDTSAGIKINIDDEHSFTLTGRIDRVDLMEKNGETYVKIIDYKSANVKLDLTEIYHGRQLQLLTYMGALTAAGDKILGIAQKPKPGGLFYFRFDDPIAEYNEAATDSDIYSSILSKFKMSGLMLRDKAVIEGLDSGITKSSDIIAVNMNKEGEYTSRSDSLAGADEFESLISFAGKKISEIGREIILGNIEAKPYKRAMKSGCDYCPYMSVCGFKGSGGSNSYNNFRKIKGLGELK